MRQLATTINRMPVRTWRWLRVNDAALDLVGPDNASFMEDVSIRVSRQIIVKRDFDGLTLGEDLTGPFVPPEMGTFIEESANLKYLIRIPKGHVEQEPIVLMLRLDAENPILVDDIVIEAEEGSSAEVILYYMSEQNTPVRHCGRTRVIARRNAMVKLVKVQMLNSTAAHTDVVGGVAEEGARLDVILAELGAARPLSNCNLTLAGEGGGADLDVLYLGDGERTLDLSCRVEHRGKKTSSRIRAKGILLERSKKVLRDTLDFISGASGSKGREEESVLMLSPEVQNVSVPLLLCGEDDVEGEHAATSGRPDDKILFYLMSRGIGELEAKKLLAQAAFSSTVEKIPDASVRESILTAVRESIERGGKTV